MGSWLHSSSLAMIYGGGITSPAVTAKQNFGMDQSWTEVNDLSTG